MLLEQLVSNVSLTDTVEFTGGIDNGNSVVAWLLERGGKAIWVARAPGLKGFPELPEHICITKGTSRSFIWLSDSVTKDESGTFRSIKRAA